MDAQEMLPGLDLLTEESAAAEGIPPAEAQLISLRACEAFEQRLLDNAALAPLAESYLNARARGFEWRKALYIAWSRLPRAVRWPASLGELASVMGLRSDRVIRTWRMKNPDIDKLITEEIMRSVGEHTADVLTALAELASRPDYKNTRAMELYLRIYGIYRPEETLHAEVSGPQFYLPATAEVDDVAS